MVILHISALSQNKSSGLFYAIPPLIYYQNKKENVKAALLNTSSKDIPMLKYFDLTIFKYNEKDIKSDLSGLPKPFNKPDLVIFHNTYIPVHMKIANHLKKRNIPYIIVPHGGMTKGAQSMKKFKKKLANILFYNKFVKNSLALHCLSEGEYNETKFWNKKIFIVGNGMSLPKEFKDWDKKQNNFIQFTFIGRLDIYHKGLDLLLDGIAKSAKNIRKNQCRFDIYGPDCSGSKKVIEKFIIDYKIQDIVKLHEPVFDDAKYEILKNTDVFVHTSRFEGLPMGILEAMAYAVPCLLTPGTNISKEILQEDAGWEVETSVDSIAEGINVVINDKGNLKQKGLNARNLVKNKYSWNNIAVQTINEYYSLLNKEN